MSTLIEELAARSREESKVRAVLKRSLAFDPGTYPPVFPYIEHRLKSDDGEWKRKVYYLVAGLWALHWRDRSNDTGQSLANACWILYWANEQSPSIERRFITLIDADSEQLPYRLRQMVALLKEYEVDFNNLSRDLLSWNHPDKFIQIRWAREFYNQAAEENEETETTNKENTQ
ncbi:MAG TPA: type I-E CRISPR-associated protein Cse2/CasB [Candidatus Omnitrophica bacterium]|nr:MAG: type I-E CRISPR-associated protein Cse2/CasB [Omnitrophica WOR_2 bacterium GWA2_45_18]OGX20268.1 MAG: type I-E CRISPR-associated protein Cse2/CasB [Omnitrophica WOR_2 bacterium GWC2_45_7]HBR14934.1 type I-E CRISPR-associated protein Cse2/CasB [Candidatus Omnitrophota bacterium]